MSRSYTVLFLIGVILMLAAGCSGAADQKSVALAPPSILPDWLSQSTVQTRDAYRYAAVHQHELEKYPCYCGCSYMGHTNNLDCYIKEEDENGTPVFDNHAVACQICVDITTDVMRLKGEGLSSSEVRAYIDETYSASGPGTNTPLPVD